MAGDPWFRFFPSDWLAGVAGLTAAERGVYVTLLAIMYDHGSAIERNDARLSRQCGLPKVGFKRALEALISTGKILVEDGKLSNNRVKNELSEREIRTRTASKGAHARWQKDKQIQHSLDAGAMQEQCVSNAMRAPVTTTTTRGDSDESPISPSLRSGSAETPVNGHSAPADLALRKKAKADAQQIVDGFLEAYAAMASSLGLPSYRAITDARQAKILARGRDCVSVLGFPTAAAGFADLFAKIRASPFLRGEGGRGSPVTLDWIIIEGNFLKIMEGNYAKAKQNKGHDLFAVSR